MARVESSRAATAAVEHTRAGGAGPAVVARQGIYDARLRLVAYELLFRPTSERGVQLRDADAATAQVLMTAFSDVGLDALVGVHRAFVNVPYAFLTEGYCRTLPTDRVVLEILEDVKVDRNVVAVARELVADGHTLALDDFVFRDDIEPLVELADIVKLDVLALSAEELAEQVEWLRPYGVTMLAEKVEDADQISGLREMGFEYFQGFALQRPTIVRAQTAGADKTVLLQMLSEMHDATVTFVALVDTVSRDPSIAYALLRMLNSAHFSLENRVASLHQAFVLLGIDGLRNWTTMMVMSRLASDSNEALSRALIRAKMCEICASRNNANAAIAFTAGLLSALPDILERPIPDIVEQLAVAPELSDALLHHGGPVGQVLAWVRCYEAQDQLGLTQLGADPTIATTFIEAVSWATRLTSALAPTQH